MNDSNSRLENCKNPYQGKAKKVLCVCSAGLLRSPTAALVLSNPPFNYNTRSAGLDSTYALIVVDDVLLHWADEIVCMSQEQKIALKQMTNKKILCLNIPDDYNYGNKRLKKMIYDNYTLVQGDDYNES